ncbi:hypothetical protein [Aliarcobacter butzleri]|uniref:DUF2283 domain-containing protein n=1 Tax=Aliarcobacter butzleri TaxID=28197 RepID=A0AAW7Q005_9BACT|nr:hypothetical protein [Aliarcobacter butzleri]MCT7564685.1 hypothetical protein [Aliarcobacter butzleri]MCT7612900.1 hypothetical protein [Aliarcobacter butzleri]MCT7620637.1 hypothetical protein [Aliarcobacter butzleri]MCT7641536.1 hypothetical protein [Aliarcobacter butzleri]MDN5071307.1 hypothetical protein [Aliarcobacter butzleri]
MQTLEYNKDKGTINLCTYSEDGFLESELDITDKVTTLVLDKLYDDYNLDDGDELLITKATNKKKKSNTVEVTTN